MKKTLILNANYLPLNIINAKRAFVLLYKNAVESLETHDDYTLQSPNEEFEVPSIVRISKNVKYGNEFKDVPFSRINILKRDNFTCVYCGSKNDLTIDHIKPRSKGGRDHWDNVATACRKCNSIKSDMTLEEIPDEIWGDRKREASGYKPHHLVLLKTVKNIPDSWKPYLFY